MFYAKYTIFFILISLAVAFSLGIIFGLLRFNIQDNVMLFIIISYFIASIIIANIIVKVNDEIMTFNRVAKCTISFSLTWIVINIIFMILSNDPIIEIIANMSFSSYIVALLTVIFIFSVSILLPLFLTNKYLAKNFK